MLFAPTQNGEQCERDDKERKSHGARAAKLSRCLAARIRHDKFPQKRWMRVQAFFNDSVDDAYDIRKAGEPANAAP